MNRDAYKKQYTTLGIAAAGVYATSGSKSSSQIPDNRLHAYLGDLVEGGQVMDKRPCLEHPDFFLMVFSGPMLKEDLPPGTCNKAFSREVLLCTAADFPNLGGYDYLSLDLYTELWRQLGARIGKRIGDFIHWEDGECQPIPLEADRWKVTQ